MPRTREEYKAELIAIFSDVEDLDAVIVTCMCGKHHQTTRDVIRSIEEETEDGIDLLDAHIEAAQYQDAKRIKKWFLILDICVVIIVALIALWGLIAFIR